ncbi:GTPase IMAP family member 8-like protein [Labeo rohita]|uniref:GTPase IMAP family member 8-like protein n=1 Tax=Labeo rohita TaxID=84645 RepID=A0A498N2P4_LABRO|nr:GTPase IMAP family member 8-like protein [Labeo rohita]RXN34219.1 GTPase IMAP family member 8-like protein [Labeo rohita]
MAVLDTPGWWKYIASELNPDFIRSAILENVSEFPEPIKTLLEREFSRWESIIIDGVRDSLQDIKSFELSQAEKRQMSVDAVERWLQNYNHYVQHTIDKIQDPESGRKRLKMD